jgi:hypothetical protein
MIIREAQSTDAFAIAQVQVDSWRATYGSRVWLARYSRACREDRVSEV